MTKPRLTKPGVTDLEWMHVVCTPETTHVEFHEDDVDAMDAARENLAPSCSAYVGRVTHQGENKPAHAPQDGMTVVFAFSLDREMRAALQKYNGANKRADYANTLRALLLADVAEIRDEYRIGRGPVKPGTDRRDDPGPPPPVVCGRGRICNNGLGCYPDCKVVFR